MRSMDESAVFHMRVRTYLDTYSRFGAAQRQVEPLGSSDLPSHFALAVILKRYLAKPGSSGSTSLLSMAQRTISVRRLKPSLA